MSEKDFPFNSNTEDDIPCVIMYLEPKVSSHGGTVQIELEFEDVPPDKFEPELMLYSAMEEYIINIDIETKKHSTHFIVPDNLPYGDYELRLTYKDWILDSHPLIIANHEVASQFTLYAKALELNIAALDAIRDGNFKKAIELNEKASNLFGNAKYLDVSAQTWKEIGSALIKANRFDDAKHAFEKAFTIFKKIRDTEGMIDTSYLLGQVVAGKELMPATKKIRESSTKRRSSLSSKRTGKFELKKGKKGKFSFNLKAANGKVVLTSQTYKTKAAAKNGIRAVLTNCHKETRFEKKVTKKGEPYFVLLAANKQVIGKSESYSSKASMRKGIASVKKNAPKARLEDIS